MVFSPTTAPEARFAFVVSTAVDRRATARNRMKRLLRESVRALLPRVQSKVDAVVVAKKGLPDTQMAVDSLVKELFTQAGLL
jgi:ribonuclease P protein component